MTTVEVITSKEKRRYWTRAEKMRWILALNEPDANASDVARRADVSTSLLYRWRQQLAAAGDGPAFVPVAVSAAAAERGPSSEPRRGTMTITFSGSVRLTIEGAPDEVTLYRVIDALAGHDRRR
jgi:transposase